MDEIGSCAHAQVEGDGLSSHFVGKNTYFIKQLCLFITEAQNQIQGKRKM